jgi:parvulin-like peptidyl-prolyl isomerase
MNGTVYGEAAMSRTDAPATRIAFHCATKWKRRIAFGASGLAVVGLAVVLRYFMASSAEAQLPNPFRGGENDKAPTAQPNAQQPSEALPAHELPKHDVMAVVNGQDIRRDALATACVERFGEEALEGIVNKRLIQHHCRNRGIQVTDAELDAEIDRMAKRFKIGREQLLRDVIERQRGVTEAQYKSDMLWPMLAIRKVAAEQLTVTEQQVQQAYESQFGEAVKCRLIVVADRALAEELHRRLASQPEEFSRLAMQHSMDVNSASIGGLIQPIRRHVGDAAIEQEVFTLQANQISKIIPVAEQFAILKCEGRLPARNVPLEGVRDELVEQIKESKLREVASRLFKELQDSATVQNVWNNPQLRAPMPGVVATVNGEQIRYEELAEACLLRFGEGVLEVEISHLLLQQALARTNLRVTDADLNAEMSHAAELAGVVDQQGRADLAKWIQMATEEQRVSKDQYLRDAVWPSAALKKLTSSAIKVSAEDLQKGFEANYGERVRCRAIVLDNMRRAQEVWGKARQNAAPDYFGDLAAEYSVEPSTKSLRGEVPPIRRYGGQPQLEEAAFDLQPGELSGIIQLGEQFVILKCEGRTEPVEVNPQEVRKILYQDIYEKKLRMAMNAKFEEIRSQARIDNFLAGTSQAPERVKPDSVTETPRVDTAVQPAAGAPAR